MAKKMGGMIPKVAGPRAKPYGGTKGAVQRPMPVTGKPASQGRPGSVVKLTAPGRRGK